MIEDDEGLDFMALWNTLGQGNSEAWVVSLAWRA